MTLHKLTAGDGCTYLTRQVAAHDATERGQAGLGEYYAEKGESPGQWLGMGLASLDLAAGDVVTEEQMVALFGHGHHPRAGEVRVPTALGRPFPTYEATTLRMQVSQASSEFNRSRGERWNAALPPEIRARIRTEVTTRMFTQRHGRGPVDARELAGFLAQASRPAATAVAGYDVTFSPVKSVSALWALAPREVADQVAAAHHAAVADSIGWLEREVAFTRVGRAGARQVPVRGLVAAVFTHRDSRAEDPDLHTHVAVANKVQTLEPEGSRWLALDGRVLFKAKVAASERYNTRLEAELVDRLGVRFTDRPHLSGKRPVREIEGIPAELLRYWSSRRRVIEHRQGELAAAFQDHHGRPPTTVEALALAQQANLETREDKHEPRSEAQQRQAWRAQAIDAFRDERFIDDMVRRTLGPGQARNCVGSAPTPESIAATATRVVAVLEESRATWQVWHVRAEAQRQARAAAVPLAHLDTTVEHVVAQVLDEFSVRLVVDDPISEPAALRRPDGHSVYDVHGATRYTSRRILAAEHELVAIASTGGGRTITEARVSIALLEAAANGRPLDPSQADMVRGLTTSGARLQVALAPAGTGKTTTLRVLAQAWRDSGGTVIGLAPSATAAAELRHAIGGPTDTLAKLTYSLTTHFTTGGDQHVPAWVSSIDGRCLVIIDEAGMASTADLAAVVKYVTNHGGSVRLVGDDQQLASVAAGGILRDLVHHAGATTLTQVHRFTDPTEAAATLAVREGDVTSLGFYADHGRIHVGETGAAVEQAYRGWQHDREQGSEALLLAPTQDMVTALNERARTDRLNHDGRTASDGREVALRDGTNASQGDIIVTRRNDRRLVVSDTDWVKNGDRWRITNAGRDGSLHVARLGHARRPQTVVLPAGYVAEHVQLGYAGTVHAAQGSTVDTTHTIVSGAESREVLYVALTRGRSGNHLYLADATTAEAHGLPAGDTEKTAVEILTGILGRDGTQESATTVRRTLQAPATQLREAVLRYHDALGYAAQEMLGPEWSTLLDQQAEQLLPGLTAQPAYPTLRAHLALRALDGAPPANLLTDALHSHEVLTADDAAAVLDWRLTRPAGAAAGAGPLPWLPAVPARLGDDPQWGTYLQQRSHRATQLAEGVFADAAQGAPRWATGLYRTQHAKLRGDLAVWRAAFHIGDGDARLTGPQQHATDAALQQHTLERRITMAIEPPQQDSRDWTSLLPAEIASDPHAATLYARLSILGAAKADVDDLVTKALAEERSLPIEHPADALWWRVVAVRADTTFENKQTPGTPHRPLSGDAILGKHRTADQEQAHQLLRQPTGERQSRGR